VAANAGELKSLETLVLTTNLYVKHLQDVLAVINQLRTFFRLCSFDLIDKIIHANNEIAEIDTIGSSVYDEKLEDFVFEFPSAISDIPEVEKKWPPSVAAIAAAHDAEGA
jgi:hypothetical protein